MMQRKNWYRKHGQDRRMPEGSRFLKFTETYRAEETSFGLFRLFG